MDNWQEFIKEEEANDYYKKLQTFVDERYEATTVFPPKKDIYNTFKLTPYENVNVVILGQDPYHGPFQAHGLSFSVQDSKAKFPPSLRNIFKELKSDLGIARDNANLADWATQGVLLLNTVLTVEAGLPASHRKKGWETFTDAAIMHLNDKKEQIVFVLWGADAQSKIPLITNPAHRILKSPHPSPLSATRGFFGSCPFSAINNCLANAGKAQIKW